MRIPFTNYEIKKRGISVDAGNGTNVPLAEWIKTRNAIMGGQTTPILENIYTTIATEFAKIDLKHVKYKDGNMSEVNSRLNYLISERPNPYQTKFDFLFTVAYQLFKYGNFYGHISRCLLYTSDAADE